MTCEIVSIGVWNETAPSVFWPNDPIYACSNCDRHYFEQHAVCPFCKAIMRRAGG